MKIKFVLPGYFDFPIGGHAVVYHYANYLARKDHDVEVVFSKTIYSRYGTCFEYAKYETAAMAHGDTI